MKGTVLNDSIFFLQKNFTFVTDDDSFDWKTFGVEKG